jgi:hypothetical protein
MLHVRLVLSMSGYLYDARRSSRRIGMPSLMSTLAKLSLLLESCDLTTGHLFEVCFTKCFPLNYFGPAAPSYYSSMGVGPSNCFFLDFRCFYNIRVRAFWSLESHSSGQRRLHIIRVWGSVPRIVLFGFSMPLQYSCAGFLVP